jgi:hypothetical protein
MSIALATITQARDDMSGMLLTGLQAAVTANTIATLPTIVWDNSSLTILPPDSATPKSSPLPVPPSWIRMRIKHVTGGQSSLSGVDGSTRYTRKGLIIAYVFSFGSDGQTLSDVMADTILSIYEGQQSAHQVWFRNGRIAEIGTSGPWWQMNVSLDFTYDQIK